MPNRNEALIDKLQVLIPRLQRVVVTLKQQEVDLAAALEAAMAIPDIFRNTPVPEMHYRERRVPHLDVAMIRAGLAVAEVAHLTAVPESRLRAIANGDVATSTERDRLMRALPDWQPTGNDGGVR